MIPSPHLLSLPLAPQARIPSSAQGSATWGNRLRAQRPGLQPERALARPPARGRRSPSGRVAPGRLGSPSTTAQLRPPETGGPGVESGRAGARAVEGGQGGQPGRREEVVAGALVSQTRGARLPLPPLPGRRQQKTPDSPSDRGHRARQQRASRAALPGRQGLSDLVSPKFMVWFQSKALAVGDQERPGGNQPNTKRKRPTRPGSVRAGLGFLGESLEAGARQPNPKERRLRGRAPATRADIQRGRGQGGRPAGGRRSARPAFAQLPPWLLLRRAGTAGPRGVPGEAERRPEPRPQRAELRARRRRRRQDKGDHVRRGRREREEEARRRRRRRLLPGGRLAS